MVAFYSQADQDIYDEGDHFIPQERYRLGKFKNTVAPMPIDSTQQVTQEFGIPNTGAFTGAGGAITGLSDYGLDESNMKMFYDQNVWDGSSWVNKPVKGYYDPASKTYKTLEGKNIVHGGHFTGDPDEGDIEGTGFQFPSITGGIIEWLKNKALAAKKKISGTLTGGKDEVIDQTIVTGTNQEGDKLGMTQGSDQGTTQGSHWDAGNQEPSGQYQFADYNQGGRVGFQEGGWSPGVGRDEEGYQSDHPSFEGGQGDKNNQSNTGGITKFVDDKNVVDVDWKTVDPSIQLNLDRSKYLAQLDLLESIKNQELEGQIGATLGPVDFTTMINEGNIGNTNINYANWSANFDPNARLQNIGYENNIKGWDVEGSYYPENQNLMFNISKTFKHGGLARIL